MTRALLPVCDAIRRRLHGPGCPGSGALGECAAMYSIAEDGESTRCIAHLYLWREARGLKASEVAAWFAAAGCADIQISAILHDPDNDIADGASTLDGVRPWDVYFTAPRGQLRLVP